MDHVDVEADLVVVGIGIAGISAALEAADRGASVVALDRFEGGGASAMSGGQLYLGGGTRFQREAGFQDTPENMYNYLKQEVGDVVRDETLRRYCEQAPGNIDWLEAHGVPFESTLCPYKTVYPAGYYLHYSGNEQSFPFADHATPAPRSHRPVGENMTGEVLLGRLIESATALGVHIRRHARATELVIEDGRVVGVVYQPVGEDGSSPAGEPVVVGARGGVVLSSGGYQFNDAMVSRDAPAYFGHSPQGMDGDDGAGVLLGQAAGGALARLDQMAAWIFLYPPTSMVRGILVGPSGTRVTNETYYGATVARAIIDHHGGRAWVITDQAVFERAMAEMPDQAQGQMAMVADSLLSEARHTEAPTLAELARKLEMEPGALEQTVAVYNRAAAAGEPDAFRKNPEYVQVLDQGPYHAFDYSYSHTGYMTLGGLVVDESSGLVRRPDGSTIDGLYAAGRDAVGICSNGYLSGLSLGDGVFSGRRAGGHAIETLKPA